MSVNERVWLGCGDESHVCRAAAILLESARAELAPLPAALRRRALARCKDLHEAALSALQVCTLHWRHELAPEPRVPSVPRHLKVPGHDTAYDQRPGTSQDFETFQNELELS